MLHLDLYLAVGSLVVAAMFVILALSARRRVSAFPLTPTLLVQAVGLVLAGTARLIVYEAGTDAMATVLGLIGILLVVAPVPIGLAVSRRPKLQA
jgi:hypothetical protein